MRKEGIENEGRGEWFIGIRCDCQLQRPVFRVFPFFFLFVGKILDGFPPACSSPDLTGQGERGLRGSAGLGVPPCCEDNIPAKKPTSFTALIGGAPGTKPEGIPTG